MDNSDYAALVCQVELFLLGKNTELVKELEGQMREASEDEEYELAGRLRDPDVASFASRKRCPSGARS